LSQAEFALKVGMSESTISHYANNRRIMSLENAKIIASTLGITIDDLYEWRKAE
jgi:transcriptional regulator with XRE-family HTH domain